VGKWSIRILPDCSVASALVTQCAPGYLHDLWDGPEPAIGPSAWLRGIDALVTQSAPGHSGGPLNGAVVGVVSFLSAYVAGLSVS
jgi:hypothetical protein